MKPSFVENNRFSDFNKGRMFMKITELTAYLEKRYPSEKAEDWDNVGLLVGDDRGEVHHVFLALDLTESVLAQAQMAGADMILTHHPMIFGSVKKINNHTFTGRKILALIQSSIAYYAMHTNFDILGMAELSADRLGLSDTQVLSVTEESESGEIGFGRVGTLSKTMTLRECAAFTKEAFGISDVKVYGDLDTPVARAAVCTGSGKSMIREALSLGAEVYVTGDIDHHTGIDTVAQGLCIIDAGHYGTEYMFMEAMEKELKAVFPQLQITCAKVENPYHIL
jgi:dinuclear metal center YbgI/SA1388 family protein